MRSDITPGQTSDYLGFDLVMDDNLPEPCVLLAEVVSRMWWKLPNSGLRACNVGSSQAARSRDIGTRG